MKRKALYFLAFVILFFAIDFTIGKIMEQAFPEITYGTYGKINTSLKADQDLLIFGSSRAVHHYNPELLTQGTGMSGYNTGLAGQGLFYNYALLKDILQKQKPELIILDLSPNIIVDPQAYLKLNVFMPYYYGHPSFNEIIRIDPDFSPFKAFFRIYVYNSTFYDYFRSVISEIPADNGYEGIKATMNPDTYLPMQLSAEETMDTTKVLYLRKFIDVAQENQVRLVCIVSPTYEKFDRQNRIIGELEKVVRNKGVEFYDYSRFEDVYGQAEYFKDQLHLNAKGVKVFNEDLRETLFNKKNQ
jgi:hypothetical protein